jgi:hypothetical protein
VKPALVAALAGGGLLLLARRAGAETTGNGMPDPIQFSDRVQRFAEAVAYAEGWYAPGDTVPKRLNNPGDLKISSVRNIGKDPQGHLHFASPADGWLALHRQIQLIVDGRSRVYTLDMSINDMGARYAPPTAGTGAWANNVADRLNVSPSTRLRDVLT